MHNSEAIPIRLARRALALCLATGRGPAAAEPPAEAVYLDIPAGPLGNTLLEIARHTGALVSFKPDIVGPYQAPPISGRHTLRQALELALASTGLTFRMTPSGVVTVVFKAAGGGLELAVPHEEPPGRPKGPHPSRGAAATPPGGALRDQGDVSQPHNPTGRP